MNENRAILTVDSLEKHFARTKGIMRRSVATVRAVDRISLDIREGETLGLVGESGSGKTTTGRCILRAVEPTAGRILFRLDDDGTTVDIGKLGREELKVIREKMSLVCQDPYSSLNPRMNVLEIVGEPLVISRRARKRRELEAQVSELLKMVGLDPRFMSRYPHAFSGGQRQRIAVARALAMRPKFVVADEPVSALDVSVQAQMLNLLQRLQEEFGLTYLFVAHNLAVVEYVSDRVAVMYVGRIVELADTHELFGNPKHPYTEALIAAVPRPDPLAKRQKIILRGEIADPANAPPGCSFHPRCQYAQAICSQEEPSLKDVSKDRDHPHLCACHFVDSLSLAGISSD